MRLPRTRGATLALTVVSIAVESESLSTTVRAQSSPIREIPTFQVDPSWPHVPSQWVMGPVSGLNVDSHDHIWIITRPREIGSPNALGGKPLEQGKTPAPPFDGIRRGWQLHQGVGEGPARATIGPTPSTA